jgi:hypothetical protein
MLMVCSRPSFGLGLGLGLDAGAEFDASTAGSVRGPTWAIGSVAISTVDDELETIAASEDEVEGERLRRRLAVFVSFGTRSAIFRAGSTTTSATGSLRGRPGPRFGGAACEEGSSTTSTTASLEGRPEPRFGGIRFRLPTALPAASLRSCDEAIISAGRYCTLFLLSSCRWT